MTRAELIAEAERALGIAGKNLDKVRDAWVEAGLTVPVSDAVLVANAYADYATACIDLARLK